jgi:hypothetical protein
MVRWASNLKFDPLPPLLNSDNRAISYFARRDLLNEDVSQIENLWGLFEAKKTSKKQQPDGSWKYPKRHADSPTNYDLFQTIKTVRRLVILFEMTIEHPAIENAINYILSYQSDEGDIRGLYGAQYSPNYSAIAMETIIEAGLAQDTRIEKFFSWILSVRQNDGGWAIPMRTKKLSFAEAMVQPVPVLPLTSKPSSHWVTDLVLRVFSVHPKYRKSEAAKKAADFLLTRLFKPDKYADRRKADYWTKFSYPFWWGDLLSSLNSFSLIGYNPDQPQIREALNYFIEHQQNNGLWYEKMLMFGNDPIAYSWLSLEICRVFKRFYPDD